MIAPPPALAISAMACLQPRKGPSRLTAWMRRHSSRVVASTLPRLPMPALLTSVSRRPNVLFRRAEIADPLLLAGHVMSEEDGSRSDAPGGILATRAVDIGDGDARALRDEGPRHGAPQPRGAAGDECRLAVKPLCHRTLPSSAL